MQKRKKEEKKEDSDITWIAFDGDVVISTNDSCLHIDDQGSIGLLILEPYIISLLDVMSLY